MKRSGLDNKLISNHVSPTHSKAVSLASCSSPTLYSVRNGGFAFCCWRCYWNRSLPARPRNYKLNRASTICPTNAHELGAVEHLKGAGNVNLSDESEHDKRLSL